MTESSDERPKRPDPLEPRNGVARSGKPTSRGSGDSPEGPKPKRKGGLRLEPLGGIDHALSHPKCVRELEPDYAEGMELWREGDIEAARDALRFALQGCGDNMWVHVALGRIALESDRDARLARGHFGYAFELAQRAIPPNFRGRIPMEHPSNEPLYRAIDGLLACYASMKEPALEAEVRACASRWSTGGGGGGARGGRGG
ncbi:MAG: hypothetical protein SFX72_03105 [Isosphaeraceae bacterium]|nr:hypothetical protein [Isosphaeraceae bacterium]